MQVVVFEWRDFVLLKGFGRGNAYWQKIVHVTGKTILNYFPLGDNVNTRAVGHHFNYL